MDKMEGILKKRLSLIRGYKDQWFQLTEDGYLTFFSVRIILTIRVPPIYYDNRLKKNDDEVITCKYL